MNCALINNQTNVVTNIIVADPETDPAPDGFIIVGLPDGSEVTFNWVYDPVSQTFAEPSN